MDVSDVIQICVIVFSAGITIGVIQSKIKNISLDIVDIKIKLTGNKAYFERTIGKIYRDFEERFKKIEKHIDKHDRMLGIENNNLHYKKTNGI